VALTEDLRRIADAAVRFAQEGEELAGIVPTEPAPGRRGYVCAYRGGDERPTWLVLDADGRPVAERSAVREAVSIAALCELAEEAAGGGDLDELRSRLVALRLTENPPGIDEAEEALLALQAVIGAAPRLATPHHLDSLGSATLRLEQALGSGPAGGSPFAAAMKNASQTAEELARDVEASYKRPLA
jgi:hypothetical protein